MANNPRIEPYIRTANTLDQIGLVKQADNVEALMRVGMAMDAGKPLFNNVEEHREYLEFLREAKKLVSSQGVNERTAGEKTFVLGEIDRYIELWSFMLGEDHKVRLAQKSLPFSTRFASNMDGELTSEQLSMLSTLAPVFRNIWLNGIREAFGKSDAAYTPKELNALGSSLVKNLEMQTLGGREDISTRVMGNDIRKELARAKKVSEMERDPEQITQVQFDGLSSLQTPEARQITELLVSKQLEPMIQKAKTPQAKEAIAANAAALINWFLEPLPNIASTMSLVEEKARMVGMPNDVALPDGFFESSAGDPETDGIRWFDQDEINHLSDRSNPKYAITNLQPSTAPLPPEEEMPFDETSGPQDEAAAAQVPGLEEAPVEAPVTPQPKGRKGKQPVETPVEPPIETPVETPADMPAAPQPKSRKGKQPVNEPIQSPVGIETPEDAPGTDIGMENTNVSEPSTPGDESLVPIDEQIVDEGQDTVNEVPNATGQESTPEETEIGRMAMGVVTEIKNIESNPDTTPEILAIIQELKDDIVNGGENRKYAFAIVLNSLIESVPITDRQPNNEILQWLDSQENSDALLEKAAYVIVTALGLNPNDGEENTTLDQEEHAPGTEETKPGHHGDLNETESNLSNDESEYEDAEDKYTGPWPVESRPMRAHRLKKLVKFLAGMGLGAAAIWGIVAQLAPAGAAKEAIQTVDTPQSGYSQPVQQQPEPQYTPPVQQQEPRYTPPIQQPQYTPPVQQPAPQQQVPLQEKPKTWANEYDDFWDTRR